MLAGPTAARARLAGFKAINVPEQRFPEITGQRLFSMMLQPISPRRWANFRHTKALPAPTRSWS